MTNNDRTRKKDSARLVWDSKPRRAPNPKDIEFQTAEVVIPNPAHREQIPLSFRDGNLGEAEIDKQKLNRLIWGDNLLAMQALLTQGYEGKINLIYIDPPFDSKADYSHKMTITENPPVSPFFKGGVKDIPPLAKGGRGDFVEIISRDTPPDIYDYLKKAKTDEDIEALSEKVKFYERPYLKMDETRIKDLKDGKVEITLSIKRYVLMDIPISQTSKKGQKDYAALMKIAKDNFAVLIDYWAVDWDYDGFTFKSQWQAFRGNGKKAKTVTTEAKEVLEKKKRAIAIRVVDIFGNDAGAVMEV